MAVVRLLSWGCCGRDESVEGWCRVSWRRVVDCVGVGGCGDDWCDIKGSEVRHEREPTSALAKGGLSAPEKTKSTDTRPPMLVESDYDSWKIRIHRYIRGKPNGKQIWKSIQNGPTPHPMITDPPPTDSAAVPAPREKLDSEFSEEENKLEMADTQAEIILSQGLPRHIFNNLNQTSTAKEIWDNVEML
ncbi:hypothetical protein Tco_1040869 [Tanacetum coccineum]|uniref:Uncharacterized protein n=1 Tax=Tanacetum coccineum TaxID=301880 RepID=A0ABQ5GFE9_9ASTR